MYEEIRFPHLGIVLEHVGKSIDVFGFSIAYYGIIIAAGMMAAMLICTSLAKKAGLGHEDSFFNTVILGIVLSVLGARIYYVFFSWDQYKDNLLDIFNIRGGRPGDLRRCDYRGSGDVDPFQKRKKISLGLLGDIGSIGIILGQIVGRWGNFFNREVFGTYTDSLFAMQLPVKAVRASDLTQEILDHTALINGVEFIQVHPTFLYESIWNLGVLLVMALVYRKKRFNGQVFLIYLGGYGLGRFWIEGIRTDQLLIPGTTWPVSQVLAAAMVAAAGISYWIMNRKYREKSR